MTRSGQAPFVGRERELARLTEGVEAAVRHEGRLVFIAGEPGIGKTRIAREAAAIATARGARVLWGACYEAPWLAPFGPWTAALGDEIRTLDDAQLIARLGPAGPLLAALAAGTPALLSEDPATVQPEQQRLRLHDAVARFLSTTAESQPLLLVLDDLHWADRDSLALLRHLARSLRNSRLLVIGTYRESEVGSAHPLADLIATLRRESEDALITLRGLDGADLAEYLARAAGEALPQALVRTIAAETAGNPFYLREVVRHLVEEGKIVRRAQGWSTDFSMAELGIPEGVRQVVGRRVARLSEVAQRTLRFAAALPGDFDFRVLHALTELPEETLLDALDEVLAAGLLREAPGAGEAYQFAHAIVRQALYGELSVSRRLRLHRRVGETLESLYAANLEPHLPALAHHFFQAAATGDAAKAVRYCRMAADRAMAVLAHEDAAAHYQRALEALALAGASSPTDEAALLLSLGEARARAGDREGMKDAFRRAAVLARRVEGPAGALLLARAALGSGLASITLGVSDADLVALLVEALAAIGPDDRALGVRLRARLAVELHYPDTERSYALSAEAVAIARRLGDPDALAAALAARRSVRVEPEQLEERLALADEALRLAETYGDRDRALAMRGARIVGLLELGEIAAVDRELAVHARLAEALRDPAGRADAAVWLAMRALLEGRLAEAENLVHRAFKLGGEAGSTNAPIVSAVQLFALRREQGRLAELEPFAVAAAKQNADIAAWRAALALLFSDLEREADARRLFDELAAENFAHVRRDGQWLIGVTMLAELCAALGDANRAASLYRRLLPYAERTVVAGYGFVCNGAAARYLALLAATMERWDAATEHFEAALSFNARLGARSALARTEYDYASLIVRRGRPPGASRARDLLDHALTTARELGMATLEAKVLGMQDSGTTRFEHAPAGSADGLTPREVEVLRLLATGRTAKQIADTLVLSVSTVERHIANLYAKIGAHGRADAIAYAFRHRLIQR